MNIITGKGALKLVSSHDILRKVPELLMTVEAYKQARKDWTVKKGCPKCQEIDFFKPIEKQAIAAIRGLSKNAILRLMEFMGAKELYLNLQNPGNKAEMVRLDNFP